MKCKNTIKETYRYKPLKINLREELLSKASVYQPFQQKPHFIKQCLPYAVASVNSSGEGEAAEGAGMQTNRSLWLPGGFYFLPNGDSLKGKKVFDLPVPIQHIQPSARNTQAAENINNKIFSCPSEQLKAGSHGFPHVPRWGPGNLIQITLPAPLCLITMACPVQYGARGLCFRKDNLGSPAKIG